MAPAPLSQGQTCLLGSLLSPLPSDHGIPTSVAFTSIEPAHIVASFCSGDTVLYDLEAESALLTLESPGSSGKGARGGGWHLNAPRPQFSCALVIRGLLSCGWLPIPSGALSWKEMRSQLLPLRTAGISGGLRGGSVSGIHVSAH